MEDRLNTIIDENGAQVLYREKYFSDRGIDKFYNYLLENVEEYSENARGKIFDREFVSNRKTVQINDPNVRTYRFTGSSETEPKRFTDFPLIDSLRKHLTDKFNAPINFCLVNFYSNEADLGWHSDSEIDMIKEAPIFSVSFGMTRRFRIREKQNHKNVLDINLRSGSLLIMRGKTQQLYDHCVAKMTKKELNEPSKYNIRVNLTFRIMKNL